MKNSHACILNAVLFALLLTSCSTAPVAKVAATRSTRAPRSLLTQKISAADPRFRYDGRFDFSLRSAPVIIWQASRVALDFEGDTIGLRFDDARGQCFFNAEVDGTNRVIKVPGGKAEHTVVLTGFGAGRHPLVLFKRSEASAGTVRFRGIELPAATQAWAPAPHRYRLNMEFIGDSITVGACNEDGSKDQWQDRRTHDSARSYVAYVARAFDADYRNIAVSGMGVVTGWVDVKAGQIWDRLYPKASSPHADLAQWTPQVVFVLLGDNDDSFTREHGQPFPAGFADRYVALIRAIRAAYPAAHIVLLRGGMYSGARSLPLRAAWTAAVTRLEAGDPAVSHFVFQHWTRLHPRVADDRILARELVTWLKQQDFMSEFLTGSRPTENVNP